jgi:hypothetical protein
MSVKSAYQIKKWMRRRLTKVWTTGTAKRISEVAATTTARRKRRFLGRLHKFVLLIRLLPHCSVRVAVSRRLRLQIHQDHAARPRLFFFQLCKPARAILTRLLPPCRCPLISRIAYWRWSLFVRWRQQRFSINLRRWGGAQGP